MFVRVYKKLANNKNQNRKYAQTIYYFDFLTAGDRVKCAKPRMGKIIWRDFK